MCTFCKCRQWLKVRISQTWTRTLGSGAHVTSACIDARALLRALRQSMSGDREVDVNVGPHRLAAMSAHFLCHNANNRDDWQNMTMGYAILASPQPQAKIAPHRLTTFTTMICRPETSSGPGLSCNAFGPPAVLPASIVPCPLRTPPPWWSLGT